MKKPVFLLGVGAQKAGTTWLYDYLQLQPEADMGFMKEYHIFDQGFVRDTTPPLGKRIQNYIDSFRGTDPLSMRFKFRRNHKHYLDFFKHQVRDSETVTLTGDITPSYAGLPANVFKAIRSKLESAGFDVKVVFLMRDPVARCISANRMYSRQRLLVNPADAALEAELLSKKYRQVRFELRTRYDKTILNLEQAFDPEQLFFGFYEELFTDQTVNNICSFLEIPFRPGKYSQVVNGSEVRNEIPAALKSEIREHYKDVYMFAQARFGTHRIRELWKMN